MASCFQSIFSFHTRIVFHLNSTQTSHNLISNQSTKLSDGCRTRCIDCWPGKKSCNWYYRWLIIFFVHCSLLVVVQEQRLLLPAQCVHHVEVRHRRVWCTLSCWSWQPWHLGLCCLTGSKRRFNQSPFARKEKVTMSCANQQLDLWLCTGFCLPKQCFLQFSPWWCWM